MKTKTIRHLAHYVFLLVIVLVGITGILFTHGQPLTQGLIIFGLAVTYFLWGLFHHLSEKSLEPEIILEYLLISVLGAGAVLAVLYYL